MRKHVSRITLALATLATVLLLTSCASQKGDYCSTLEGTRFENKPNKVQKHPASGTPIGGNYNTNRR